MKVGDNQFWAYNRLQAPHHSLGATPIGSTGRAPDKKNQKEKVFSAGRRLWLHSIKLCAYTWINENSTIASAATPIGSADRTPDDRKLSTTSKEPKIDFIIGGKH
jgi:hypothetical protein